MKKSEAIEKLMRWVIPPTEIITKEAYDSGVYQGRAKALLEFIEGKLGMIPSGDMSDRDRQSFGATWDPE